jgi:hypothetical protein
MLLTEVEYNIKLIFNLVRITSHHHDHHEYPFIDCLHTRNTFFPHIIGCKCYDVIIFWMGFSYYGN